MEELYKKRIEDINKKIAKNRNQRNFLTVEKIICFLFIVFFIYKIIDTQNNQFIWLCLLSIISFILLNIADTRTVRKMALLRSLLKCSETELAYLNGDMSGLDTGNDFTDPAHAYSSDLDIFGNDSVFQAISRCNTPRGRELLAKWLTTPLLEKESIILRQDSVKELAGDIEWCHKFRANADAFGINRTNDRVIEEWRRAPLYFNSKTFRIFIYILNAATIALFICALTGLLPWIYAICLITVQFITVMLLSNKINKQYSYINTAASALINYFNLVLLINEKEFSSEKNRSLKKRLTGSRNIIKAFKELKGIVDALDQRSNIIALFVFNGLFTRDIHTIFRLNKWKERYNGYLDGWIEIISKFDALTSMANFFVNNDSFIIPEISYDTIVTATETTHPMLRNGVRNDFSIKSMHEFRIITGANMAGKSTFLRTIGVNMVLALSGNVVCAETFSIQPIDIYTSMRTTDNLTKGTSYFHAELLRLKGILELSQKRENLFIIIDEMLKGTNSHDKLNGSRLFLRNLLNYNISGIIATHDLELGELEQQYPDNYRNACFEIEHNADDIIYDYKLKEGVSQNMNASILLKKMNLV